jgi:hypothetical protein
VRRAQANHSMRRRKSKGEVKTGLLRLVQDKFGGKPVYCLSGLRRKGGVNLSLAFARNLGTLHVMLRENPISETHEGGKYRCT